jgi:DNA primase catalytic core
VYVSKEAIERVRRSLDLVVVIESRGVKLARKGRNWVGLCPFHEDREPSLVVNPERQLWNCFGACRSNGGKSGGDVFAFVAKADGVSFLEAMKRLGYEEPDPPKGNGRRPRAARELSSAMSETVPAPVEIALPRRAELLARVVAHYHRVFRERSEGQDYLRSRGLDDAGTLSAFEVGYVDGSLVSTFDAEGDVAQVLREIGLVNARGREHFLGCVVFPLALPDAGVVGFYGRHVKRDQHLYLPGPRRGVFHWQAMKGSEEVILTESVLDALTLFAAGLRNVSCVYGTQGFTPDHEELLQRFRVKRVRLCLDNDEAGTQATAVLAERLRKLGIDAIDARVPGAKDPNALFQALGADAARAAFTKALAPSPPLTVKATDDEKTSPVALAEPSQVATPPAATPGPRVTPEPGGGWLVAFASRTYRVRGMTATGLDRLRVNLRVEAAGRVHLDTLDLYSHRARSGLVQELTRLFGKDEEELAREIAALVDALEGLRLELARKGAGDATSPRIQVPDGEREEALRLLRAPDLLDRILSDFERTGFVGEKTALTVGYLGTISRLLDEPLGLLIVSRSGAGKSSLEDALCDFVPEEDLSKYTRLTGQALFYKDEDSLAHKVLAIEEEQGAAEAAYSIRTLQSAQALTIATTRSDPQTGKLRTEEYRVRGPVFILLTTTSPEALDYETRNRFVQVGIDESAEQTRRILRRQREADTLDGVLRREETSAVCRRQQNLQRLLRPLKVVNPYAPQLAYPDERLQMRREQKKYLTLIKTITLLHQHQREVKRAARHGIEVEYVEVLPSDIALANRLAREVLGLSLDELAHPTRLLLKHLVELTQGRKRGEKLFTRQDVREATGWTDWQVRIHLAQLVDLEYVVLACGRNGRRMTYELLFDGDPDEDRRYLAGLVDVAALPRKGNGRVQVEDSVELVTEKASL